MSECIGVTTNNVAEYHALIAGLEAVAGICAARRDHVRADSLLVIKQLRGEWKVKHENMRPLARRGARSCSPRTRSSISSTCAAS